MPTSTSTSTRSSHPLAMPPVRTPRPPRLEPGAHTGRPPSPRSLEVLEQLETIYQGEGFAHLTAQDLASRLQCSRRMLYQLAPTLDELAALIVDRFIQRMGRRSFAAAATCATRATQLETFTTTGMDDWANTDPAFNRDIQALPVTRRLVDTHFAFWATVFESIVELGVAEGEFVDINAGLAAQIVLAGALRLFDPRLLKDTGLDVATAVKEMGSLFINGIQVRR